MAEPFYFKRGDCPLIAPTLIAPSKLPANITGATAVWMHIYLHGAKDRVVSRQMTIVTPASGAVSYQIVNGDWTADTGLEVGRHEVEYEVLGISPARLSYPNYAHDEFVIHPDIGQA